MVLSDDTSYCLVSSHIQHGLNYHSDKVGRRLTRPDQTTAGLLGNTASWSTFTREMLSKVIFVQDSKDLREAIYHISKLS